MERAVASGMITPERLDASVRRVLEAKRSLGLFGRRTVALDSIPAIVGSAAFQADAAAIAAQSIVMVKDSAGVIHSMTSRPAVTLVTYAEEENRQVGLALALELRAQGFPVTMTRLWPSSGLASYDSVTATLRRSGVVVFATADRPIAGRGTIGLPSALMALIARTARERATVLVSLGNPYVITGLPEVGSYLIGWRSNAVTEQAIARALAGAAPITGRLPIALPPKYARGWGLQRHVP